jgi:hypothetical protein
MAACEKARQPYKARTNDSSLHTPKYLVEYKGQPVADLGKSLASHSKN